MAARDGGAGLAGLLVPAAVRIVDARDTGQGRQVPGERSPTLRLRPTSTTPRTRVPAAFSSRPPLPHVNWADFRATVGKNAWNLRTGSSAAYASRGYLYRGDKLTVLCSRGSWGHAQLGSRSRPGIAKGTRGWVRSDGPINLAG